MPQLDELFVTLGIKDNRFTATMKKGAKTVDVLQRELTELNKVARKTGSTANNASQGVNKFQQSMLSSEITAAAFAFTLQRVLANALDAFVEFEQGIIDVTKVINQFGQDDIPALENSLISLSQTLPLTRTELINIGRTLGQLGFFAKTSGAQIVDAFQGTVDLVGRLSVATDLSAEQASQSLGVLRNVFLANETSADKVTKTLSRFGDVANEISNTTAATATDVFRFNAAIGATATQLGLTFNEVSGYAAAIRQLGITVDVGATALQRFFGLAITRAEVFADAIGVSEEEFRKLFERSPNDALLRFFKALNEATAERQAQILKGISAEQRLVRVLNGIAGNLDLVTSAQVTANEATEEGISVLEEFSKVNKSTNASLVRFGNSLSNALVQGFQSIAPVFNAFLDSVTVLANTFPSLTVAAGAFVVIAGSITAALLSLSILVPRVAQGYQLLTNALRGNRTEQTAWRTAALPNLITTSSLSTANNALAASITRVTIAQRIANSSLVKGVGKLQVAGGALRGTIGAFFGTFLVGALLSASSRVRALAEEMENLTDAPTEKVVENFRRMAQQVSVTENTVAGLFNLLTTGSFTTLSDNLEEAARDLEESDRRLRNRLARTISEGLSEDATRAQVARAKLLQNAIDELGFTVEAYSTVNVNSLSSIERLRKEFGATEEQLYALAAAADEAGNQVNTVRGENFESFTQRVRAFFDAYRREQAKINDQQELSEELSKAVTDARNREARAAENVLATLRKINDERRDELENESDREDRQVNIQLAVTQRQGELENLIDGAINRIRDVAESAGKEVEVNLDFNTGELSANTSQLTRESKDEVEGIIEAVRIWLRELNDIEVTYESVKDIIATTETEQQALARQSREALEDNTLALQREEAERQNNFEALRRIERAAVELRLARLASEQEAAEDTVEVERAFQAQRTAVLQNYANRRAQIARDEIQQRLEANTALRQIIDSRRRANVTTELQEQQIRLEDLKNISNEIVASVGDEQVKREALKSVIEEIRQIVNFGLDEEKELRAEIATLENERLEEVQKRIREERVAAENDFNEVKRTVNLNTRAGRQAVEAAEIERDLKKEIAELEADGIVTASEIDQIEQRRLEAAQRIAELTGQTRQAAGRDQLQDDLERIRDEARAQRAALENVDGLDEQAVVDSNVETDLRRRQNLENELNEIISTRNSLSVDATSVLQTQLNIYDQMVQRARELATVEATRGPTTAGEVTEGVTGDTALQASTAPVDLAEVGLDVDITSLLTSLNNIENAVDNVNTAFDASAGSVNVAAQGVQTAASNFEQTLSPTLRNMTNALEATRGAFQNITDTVEDLDERIHVIEQIFNRAGD